MVCASCGNEVDTSGAFPGGTVTCACGAQVRVPPAPPPPPAPASTAAHAAASAPVSTCPRCDGGLDVREAEGVIVAACARGHGLFITHAALRAAKTEGLAAVRVLDAAPPSPLADDTTHLRCPRCREAMAHGPYGGSGGAEDPVIVDVCATHGTWFDAGELRAALTLRATKKPIAPAAPDDLMRRAGATLDVALALETARDVDTARRAIDTADDLLDTFNLIVLGRTRLRRGVW